MGRRRTLVPAVLVLLGASPATDALRAAAPRPSLRPRVAAAVLSRAAKMGMAGDAGWTWVGYGWMEPATWSRPGVPDAAGAAARAAVEAAAVGAVGLARAGSAAGALSVRGFADKIAAETSDARLAAADAAPFRARAEACYASVRARSASRRKSGPSSLTVSSPAQAASQARCSACRAARREELMSGMAAHRRSS